MSQFDDMIQNGRDTAAAAKARMQQGYGDAKIASGDLAAKGRAQAQKLGEKVAPAVERSKAKAAEAQGKLKATAEAQPLTLLVGAVALGAVLGALLPKRTKPEE